MEKLETWLRVSQTPGLGSAWLQQWDSKVDLLTWLLASNLPAKARAYLQQQHSFAAELKWQAQANHYILTWSDALYPACFRRLARPPVVLYASGDINSLKSRRVAIVGARKSSHFGREFAQGLAAELAQHALVVVSGMALGIDASAHQGALEYGHTIAVTGSGIDNIYPPQHVALASKIKSSGLLLSPFRLSAGPRPQHFLQRNVLISALSEAVVVVEAAARSGSLSTARAALDQGIDVWAVPWSPGHIGGAGCLQLLSDGAGVLRSSQDLLQALGLHSENSSESIGCYKAADTQEALDHDCKLLLECMRVEAQPIASLCTYSGLNIVQCLRALGLLELNGLIKAEGCGYVRI